MSDPVRDELVTSLMRLREQIFEAKDDEEMLNRAQEYLTVLFSI
jgi:hypothetical protein